jgi:hypothetical protein
MVVDHRCCRSFLMLQSRGSRWRIFICAFLMGASFSLLPSTKLIQFSTKMFRRFSFIYLSSITNIIYWFWFNAFTEEQMVLNLITKELSINYGRVSLREDVSESECFYDGNFLVLTWISIIYLVKKEFIVQRKHKTCPNYNRHHRIG